MPRALKPDPSPAPLPTSAAAAEDLFRRAERGDEAVLPEVRRLLDRAAAVPEAVGLARTARDALARLVGGTNLLRRELTTREMDQWRAELLGPAPTALERLLVERVVFARVQVLDAEIALGGCRLRDWDFYQRRLDHAHRRFLAAARALDSVRRKLAPALQVNVARQQVNVAAADALASQAGAIGAGEPPAEPALPARKEPGPPEPGPVSPPAEQTVRQSTPRDVAAAPARPPAECPAIMLRPPRVRRFAVAQPPGLPGRAGGRPHVADRRRSVAPPDVSRFRADGPPDSPVTAAGCLPPNPPRDRSCRPRTPPRQPVRRPHAARLRRPADRGRTGCPDQKKRGPPGESLGGPQGSESHARPSAGRKAPRVRHSS